MGAVVVVVAVLCDSTLVMAGRFLAISQSMRFNQRLVSACRDKLREEVRQRAATKLGKGK